jgi:hypothetical protein
MCIQQIVELSKAVDRDNVADTPVEVLRFVATFVEHPACIPALRELRARGLIGKAAPVQVKLPWSDGPRETLELNDGRVFTRAGVMDFVRRDDHVETGGPPSTGKSPVRSH